MNDKIGEVLINELNDGIKHIREELVEEPEREFSLNIDIEAHEMAIRYFSETYKRNLKHYNNDESKMDDFLLTKDLNNFQYYTSHLFMLGRVDNHKNRTLHNSLKGLSQYLIENL